MAEGKSVRCSVCGFPNPPGIAVCKECGNKLAPPREAALDEEEIDKLLEDLGEMGAPPPPPKDKGGLDIEKEIVDELLDSLLVEEEKGPKEAFECPMCGTSLPADAISCTSCGVEFEAPAPKEVLPPPIAKEVTKKELEAPPKVDVSEVDMSRIR